MQGQEKLGLLRKEFKLFFNQNLGLLLGLAKKNNFFDVSYIGFLETINNYHMFGIYYIIVYSFFLQNQADFQIVF